MNKIFIAIIALVVIGGGAAYFLTKGTSDTYEAETGDVVAETQTDEVSQFTVTVPDKEESKKDEPETVIGTSVNGNDITAFHFGEGDKEVLFIGGTHGGYSWNTALVAYELVDYLQTTPDVVPEGVKVTVIPVLNPDGLESVVGDTGRFKASDVSTSDAVKVAGRFNANEVDLNRNFDCQWSESATWQSRSVSGGSKPFSEPEAAALRDYVQANEPDAVVVWYSAAGGVFASQCGSNTLPDTAELINVFADASGYKAFEEFDFYEITGDMVNWLAKEGIPAISVLLTTREATEWSKNKKGIEAVLNYIAE